MRIVTSIATLTVLLVGTWVASAVNPPQDATQQQSAAASSAGTLTGCLKGTKDQYYLVEQNGKRHTLMAKNQDMSSYVNHQVTVTGKASAARAGGSDAEGNRKGFFSVDSVNDQGACKK
jgi:hypothetical protein